MPKQHDDTSRRGPLAQNSRQDHATLSAHVATVLRRRIAIGEVADGAVLPRQEDLQAEFGVSHPSLREALRMLEGEGLLTVRRGKLGGSIAHRPKAETASFTIGLVLEAEGTRLDDTARALARLEPECAVFCAERADRAELVVPELRRLNQEIAAAVGDPVEFSARTREFHAAITRLCGNNTLRLLTGALDAVWSEQILQWTINSVEREAHAKPARRRQALPQHEDVKAVEREAHAKPAEQRRALRQHEQIIAAINAGDASRTRRHVRQHAEEAVSFWLSGAKAPLVEVSGRGQLYFTRGKAAQAD